jgi:ubiquitin-protein ligase
MDCMQFAISGPEDTPYSGGLFLFDTFFPTDYPSSCPKVNLQTTGQGTVRA